MSVEDLVVGYDLDIGGLRCLADEEGCDVCGERLQRVGRLGVVVFEQ